MSDAAATDVASLKRLSRQLLQQRWRDLHKVAPPEAFTPDLLARGIAWRLQEKALGGLPVEACRLLKGDQHGRGPNPRAALRPGNRLVRRWRGTTYVVEVIEEGFTYADAHYGSLSEIARTITGTRWSGPKFFGLVQ